MDTLSIDRTTGTNFVEAIEREISRLKAARPHLSSRIERAEHILVTHLSIATGTHKPVKVRLHADGSRSFAVKSTAKLRRRYSVEAGTFRCDCPDSRRRHAACKHGIAAYILERALRRPSRPSTCAGCSAPSECLFEVVDSLTFFAGDLVCSECFSASDCW
jgi:hypothetical protein